MAVLHALLGLHPFRRVYVADLDAISGRSSTHMTALHMATIQEARQSLPDLEFWVDSGVADAATLQRVLQAGLTPVLGTESLRTTALLDAPAASGAVLSLDYRNGQFLGPPMLEQDAGAWPARVILMDLGRVGSDSGPDFTRLAELRRRLPDHEIYAAGGVRDTEDLRRLEALRINGVLIATALHEGRLGAWLSGRGES